MKLIIVLMLAALPLCCYAGSGCQLLEDIISDSINSTVSVEEFQDSVSSFVQTEDTNEAMAEFKQCFLDQSEETLVKVQELMNIIYSSPFCAIF